MDLPENYVVILLHEGNINLKLKKVVVTNTIDSIIITNNNNESGGVYSYTQIPKHLIKSIEIHEESYTLDEGLSTMLDLLKQETTIFEISH